VALLPASIITRPTNKLLSPGYHRVEEGDNVATTIRVLRSTSRGDGTSTSEVQVQDTVDRFRITYSEVSVCASMEGSSEALLSEIFSANVTLNIFEA
jgi:hypothetical protein